jgi:CRP-like cAMP-binding protein
MINKGEYIIQAGEVGLEMYFILDGSVDVISSLGEYLASLSAGQPFGEIALLPEKPTVRNASVIATCLVSLAVLEYD